MSILSGYHCKGMWWFRVFGYGLDWKDMRLHRPLFSERYGYKKHLHLGNWSFEVLLRERRAKEQTP